MKTEFYKCMGATERRDQVIKISRNNYLLIFGYGEEDGQGYSWRKYYDHAPTASELKADIYALINAQTDARILTGMEYDGHPVYLSQENQYNLLAAIGAADRGATTLPVTFKLWEDDEVRYHTFETLEELHDFADKVFNHVTTAVTEGWKEKDNVDYVSMMQGY